MRKQHLNVASVVIAIAFQGAALTDAAVLHGCPHHSLPGAATTGAPDHAEGMAMGGGEHHDRGDSHGEGHGGPCTCVGSCQSGGADVSHALTARSPHTLDLPVSYEAPIAAVRLELPSAPSFLLPYSHGPPRTA